MARNISSIESHPQRRQIVEAIISGQTIRQISAWASPAVSTAAISRFRTSALATARHAVEVTKAAIANNDKGLQLADSRAVSKAAVLAATDPFIARVEELRADRQRVKDLCLKGDDMRTWSSLDRNDLTELEIHAKLAGRYNDGSQTTINIVVPMAQQPAVEPQDFEVIDIKAAT